MDGHGRKGCRISTTRNMVLSADPYNLERFIKHKHHKPFSAVPAGSTPRVGPWQWPPPNMLASSSLSPPRNTKTAGVTSPRPSLGTLLRVFFGLGAAMKSLGVPCAICSVGSKRQNSLIPPHPPSLRPIAALKGKPVSSNMPTSAQTGKACLLIRGCLASKAGTTF